MERIGKYVAVRIQCGKPVAIVILGCRGGGVRIEIMIR